MEMSAKCTGSNKQNRWRVKASGGLSQCFPMHFGDPQTVPIFAPSQERPGWEILVTMQSESQP